MPTVNAKRIKLAGKCIFCGDGKLTREHIWPRWADEFLPDSAHSMNWRGTSDPRGNLIGPPRSHKRQGGVKKITVRSVCGSCNNGWMSAIEEAAKPTLVKFILGEKHNLRIEELRVLSNWIVLKMMVAEHSPPADPAITQSAKTAFFERREIPPGLKISAYLCGGDQWKTAYRRWAGTLSASEMPGYDTRLKNAASVTLGFGEALFHCAYFGDLDIREPPIAFKGGVPIWPSESSQVWPPDRRLSDREASQIAEAFEHIRRLPRVRIVD